MRMRTAALLLGAAAMVPSVSVAQSYFMRSALSMPVKSRMRTGVDSPVPVPTPSPAPTPVPTPTPTPTPTSSDATGSSASGQAPVIKPPITGPARPPISTAPKPVNTSQAAQLASSLVTTAAAATTNDPIAEALKSIAAQVTTLATDVGKTSAASQQSATAAVNNLVQQFNAYNAMLLNQQVQRASSSQDPSRYRSTRASLYATNKAPGSAGSYSTLAQVGVRQDAGGTMRVDKSRLEAAASRDPQSVFRLVAGDSRDNDGLLGQLRNDLSSLVTSYAVSANNVAASGSLLGANQATANVSDEADTLTDYYRALSAVS